MTSFRSHYKTLLALLLISCAGDLENAESFSSASLTINSSLRPQVNQNANPAPVQPTTPTSTPTPMGLPCDPQPILTAKCAVAGCHAAGSPNTQLVAPLIDNTLNKAGTGGCSTSKIVDASNPTASLLATKLKDTVPCGTPMKLFATSLTADEAACITNWAIAVAGGAR